MSNDDSLHAALTDVDCHIDFERLTYLESCAPVEPLNMPGVEVICEFGALDGNDIVIWQSKLQAGERYFPPSKRHVITLSLFDIPRSVCLHNGQFKAGPFSAGELLIAPAGGASYIHIDTPGEFLHLAFATHALQGLSASAMRDGDIMSLQGPLVVQDAALSRLVQALSPEAHAGKNSLSRSFVDSVVQAVCVHLSQCYRDAALPNTKGLRDSELERLADYLLRHLSHPVGVIDASLHLGMSAASLARRLKLRTGQSFSEYARNLRLSEAHRLLTSGQHNVTEVAMATGFADLPHFSRHFKRKFGVRPSTLRGR